jgi:hypothetical protein
MLAFQRTIYDDFLTGIGTARCKRASSTGALPDRPYAPCRGRTIFMKTLALFPKINDPVQAVRASLLGSSAPTRWRLEMNSVVEGGSSTGCTWMLSQPNPQRLMGVLL